MVPDTAYMYTLFFPATRVISGTLSVSTLNLLFLVAIFFLSLIRQKLRGEEEKEMEREIGTFRSASLLVKCALCKWGLRA